MGSAGRLKGRRRHSSRALPIHTACGRCWASPTHSSLHNFFSLHHSLLVSHHQYQYQLPLSLSLPYTGLTDTGALPMGKCIYMLIVGFAATATLNLANGLSGIQGPLEQSCLQLYHWAIRDVGHMKQPNHLSGLHACNCKRSGSCLNIQVLPLGFLCLSRSLAPSFAIYRR